MNNSYLENFAFPKKDSIANESLDEVQRFCKEAETKLVQLRSLYNEMSKKMDDGNGEELKRINQAAALVQEYYSLCVDELNKRNRVNNNNNGQSNNRGSDNRKRKTSENTQLEVKGSLSTSKRIIRNNDEDEEEGEEGEKEEEVKSERKEAIKVLVILHKEVDKNSGVKEIVYTLLAEGVEFPADHVYKVRQQIHEHAGYLISFYTSSVVTVRENLSKIVTNFGYMPRLDDNNRINSACISVKLLDAVDRKKISAMEIHECLRDKYGIDVASVVHGRPIGTREVVNYYVYVKSMAQAVILHNMAAICLPNGYFTKANLSWKVFSNMTPSVVIGRQLCRDATSNEINKLIVDALRVAGIERNIHTQWIRPRDDNGNMIGNKLWVRMQSQSAADLLETFEWELRGYKIHWTRVNILAERDNE